jgi:hypothetical protein
MANPSGSNQVLTKIYNAILNAIRVHVVGSELPDGAATEDKQDDQISLLTEIELNTDGLSKVHAPVRNNYASVNVTTAAYVELVSSLSAAAKALHIFDSSGRTLVLAVGAAASEVDQIFIVPGGNDFIPLAIAAGSRISIKAVSANATSGELNISFLG